MSDGKLKWKVGEGFKKGEGGREGTGNSLNGVRDGGFEGREMKSLKVGWAITAPVS